MHTVFALLCFVVVIHWLIFPYPPGLLRWHCGSLTIAPVPAKQPWWIWINTSCEIIMDDYITTTKQSTTKPCAYLLGYTVFQLWTEVFTCWFFLLSLRFLRSCEGEINHGELTCEWANSPPEMRHQAYQAILESSALRQFYMPCHWCNRTRRLCKSIEVSLFDTKTVQQVAISSVFGNRKIMGALNDVE